MHYLITFLCKSQLILMAFKGSTHISRKSLAAVSKIVTSTTNTVMGVNRSRSFKDGGNQQLSNGFGSSRSTLQYGQSQTGFVRILNELFDKWNRKTNKLCIFGHFRSLHQRSNSVRRSMRQKEIVPPVQQVISGKMFSFAISG